MLALMLLLGSVGEHRNPLILPLLALLGRLPRPSLSVVDGAGVKRLLDPLSPALRQ